LTPSACPRQTQERKRTKEEREVHARFAVFSRFHSAAEHEALVEGVVAEHRLRARIEELKDYRRAGIHTLAEAEVYENEK
jgi:transcriptional adapter 2-alpha